MAWGGRILVLFTWILILYGCYVANMICIFPWFSDDTGYLGLSILGELFFICFNSNLFLAFLTHVRCVFSDPGKTPPLNEDSSDIRFCQNCSQIKPDRTHHCKSCKSCFHKMDHHCPWIHNCVAWKNHKFFFLFNLYICLSSLIGLILVFSCGFRYFNAPKRIRPRVLPLILTSFFVVECVGFVIFTGENLYEHLFIILDNQTVVDSYQDKWGPPAPVMKLLTEVFGSIRALWPFPVYTDFTPNYFEPVFTEADRWALLRSARSKKVS